MVFLMQNWQALTKLNWKSTINLRLEYKDFLHILNSVSNVMWFVNSKFNSKSTIGLTTTTKKKNHSTQDSRVVPHRGTNWAALWLTAQIERDAVLSESYGRGYNIV